MLDNLRLARASARRLAAPGKAACRQEVATVLDAIAAELHGPQATLTLLSTLTVLTADAVEAAGVHAPRCQ